MFKDYTLDIYLVEIAKYSGWVILILGLNLILQRLAKRFVANRPEFKSKFLPSFISILNWVSFYGIILLFLFTFSRSRWFLSPIYTIGDLEISVALIIISFMVISLAHRFLRIFTRSILSSFFEYYEVDKGVGYTLSKVIYYTFMIGAVILSFSYVGIDLTSLAAVFGVLGIGIGFGMRNVAGNFISGIIILFERPFEIGEVIQVDDKVGRVERIRLRSTVVRTVKEGKLIVPNQYFIEQIIKNRSGAERLAQVNVCVLYGTETSTIKSLLEQSIKLVKERSDGYLPAPSHSVRFVDFRNKAMEFVVEIPVKTLEAKEEIESELRFIIADIFSEQGIEVPDVFVQKAAE